MISARYLKDKGAQSYRRCGERMYCMTSVEFCDSLRPQFPFLLTTMLPLAMKRVITCLTVQLLIPSKLEMALNE